MSTVIQDPVFGSISPNGEGYWEARLTHQGRDVMIDLNAEDEDSLDLEAIRSLTAQAANLAQLDRAAREAILAEDLEDEDGPLPLYMSLHFRELKEEDLHAALGADGAWRSDPRVFVERLRLVRVGLYPEEAEDAIVVDLTISPDLTDYLLSVSFDQSGSPTAVNLES